MRAEGRLARVAGEARAARLSSTTRFTTGIDPIAEFCASKASEAGASALWLRPASGEAQVALGSAATFDGPPERVAAGWRALLARAHVDSVSGVGPRLLGGFAFDPRAATSQLWDGFGVGRFVLPARHFTVHGPATLLTTNSLCSELPCEVPPASRHAGCSATPARLGRSAADWQTLVRDVAAMIGRGDAGMRKVVLARAQPIQMRVTIEAALRRLAAEYPTCTIFAFSPSHGSDACFLGATPERLVALHDGTATTMALAGSAPRGETPEQDRAIGERLLRDPKERTEHAVVADVLREALTPLAARVIAEAEPRLHTLPNLQHLITPIRAQMKPGRDVLDLVGRLHPTPAVGGYPPDAALRLIREREGLDRGWYAGPIGWVDARGEGEFMVGLRSALVRGDTATLFAGGGIVASSDPATELAELGWKLKPMATALGAS